MKKWIPAALTSAVLGLGISANAFAYEPGDWVVRVGAATVAPDESSDMIDVAGLALLDGVSVDNNTQLGITATYMVSDHWGVELLAATPFSHDITVNGVGIPAGDTKHLPPTLSAQYYFADAGSKFQPYIGLGVNYTVFFDESVSGDLEAALGAITEPATGSTAPVPAELELDDSVGLAVQLGFDYAFSDSLGFNLAIWNIGIETEATIKTALADVSFDVDIDPWVYMVGLAYTF